MRWVDVPSLEVSITFDSDGFVTNYPGIGVRA